MHAHHTAIPFPAQPQTTYDPTHGTYLPEGYYLPSEHDIFPILLHSEIQRRVLFADAMHWFGYPKNWTRSQSEYAVAKYIRLKAASPTRRFDLSDNTMACHSGEALTAICTDNLASRAHASGAISFANRCTWAGVWGGKAQGNTP